MELLTRRVLYMINLDVCRIKFPSLEGLGVGFIRKISFLESQIIPIGLITLPEMHAPFKLPRTTYSKTTTFSTKLKYREMAQVILAETFSLGP
ncbi:MAG: hypothetical protein ACJA2N_002161 [Salibacteraceae bacterium]|jgi:hypothetical protein